METMLTEIINPVIYDNIQHIVETSGREEEKSMLCEYLNMNDYERSNYKLESVFILSEHNVECKFASSLGNALTWLCPSDCPWNELEGEVLEAFEYVDIYAIFVTEKAGEKELRIAYTYNRGIYERSEKVLCHCLLKLYPDMVIRLWDSLTSGYKK